MHNYLEVNAAGGLVTNENGEYLLIRRSGLWDLPKGHQDPGEPMEHTAIREVEEETGLHGLELKEFICTTDHCYFRNEKWYLKHTWWYSMTYSGNEIFVPQKEEGITEVAWIKKPDLASYLLKTYPTIIEVFRSVGLSEKFLPTLKQNEQKSV